MVLIQLRKQLGIINNTRYSNILGINLKLLSSLDSNRGNLNNPSFSRSTLASVIDYEGTIHNCKIDESRFTGARRVENLQYDTENIVNGAYYTATSITMDNDVAIAPDGTLTADNMIETASENEHLMELSSANITTGKAYAISIFAKAAIGIRYLTIRGLGIGTDYPIFNLQNGTIENSGSEWISTKIEDYGNGWYRCSAIGTATSDALSRVQIQEGNTVSDKTYAGDGVSGVYLWGAQVELINGTQSQTSEYVSNGVLSAPYHGANVDGVKYFISDNDRNAISDSIIKGVLIESESTNIVPYSICSVADWGVSSATRTDLSLNIFNRFDGVRVASTGGDWNRTNTTYISLTAGTVYSGFCYVIKGTSNMFRLTCRNDSSQGSIIGGEFGSIVTTQETAGTLDLINETELYDDIVRIDFQFIPNNTENHTFGIGPNSNTSGEDIIVLGLQVEASNFSSSYIETNGTAVTRTKDELRYDISSLTIPTKGTLYCEFKTNGVISGYPRILELNDNTSNNRITFFVYSTGNIGMAILNSTVTQAEIVSTITFGDSYKIAVTYENNNMSFFINGVKIGTDTSGDIPTLTYLDIGGQLTGPLKLNGEVKNVKYYNQPLTEKEAINITK